MLCSGIPCFDPTGTVVQGHHTNPWLGRRLRASLVIASVACCSLLYARLAGQLPHQARTVATMAGVPMLHDSRRLASLVAPLKMDIPCANRPSLQILETTYTKLSGNGRGHESGLVVWKAVSDHTLTNQHNEELLLYASITGNARYDPATQVGTKGAYGFINLRPGSHAQVTLEVQNAKTNKQHMLSTLSLTIFDLNAGDKGTQGDSVTANGFWDYSLDEDTYVKVEQHADGRTTFEGLAHGTGDDNPFNLSYTGPQQRKRAVSLNYRDASKIGCTLTAGAGKSPGKFLLVPLPSLDCTSQPGGDFRGQLDDLDWRPPLEVPVVAGRQEKFLGWIVKQGNNVDAGDKICEVRLPDATIAYHKAPFAGFVKLLQVELKTGDDIDARLSERTLAVVSRASLPPLNASGTGSTIIAVHQHGLIFVRWRSKPKSFVRAGSVVAEVRDMNGRNHSVRSNSSGFFMARQDGLREGDPIDLITGGSLAEIGKLPPLDVEAGAAPTLAKPGLSFVAWTGSVSDWVEQGDEIATLKGPGGGDVRLLAPRAGVVVCRQDRLALGMDLDTVMTDRNLATVGQAPPFKTRLGETVVQVPVDNSWLFEAWNVSVGDVVMHGDVVAFIKLANGTRRTVLAPKSGSVKAIQEHLRESYNISSVVPDHAIAVIGKFDELLPGHGELAVLAPPNAIFKRWLVAPGDSVDELGCVAEVEVPTEGSNSTSRGRKLLALTPREVFAAQGGTMSHLQPLIAGKRIEDQQTGLTIATVAVLVIGEPTRNQAERNQTKRHQAKRRFAQSGSSSWQRFSGLAVGLFIFAGLALGMCVLEACSGSALRKRYQEGGYQAREKFTGPYLTVDSAAVKPAVHLWEKSEESRTSAGLRLDFMDDENVVTVYAQYYPLGIKHNNDNAAIVSGFSANSYAKAGLGVQMGWRLVCIDRAMLSNALKPHALMEVLDLHMKDLPSWPLEITFRPSARVSAEADKVCVFSQKPLGIELANKLPARVRRIQAGSLAEAAGVRNEWLIVSIGQFPVQPGTALKEVLGHLQEATAALPWGGRDFEGTNARSSCGPCGGGSSQALRI